MISSSHVSALRKLKAFCQREALHAAPMAALKEMALDVGEMVCEIGAYGELL